MEHTTGKTLLHILSAGGIIYISHCLSLMCIYTSHYCQFFLVTFNMIYITVQSQTGQEVNVYGNCLPTVKVQDSFMKHVIM